MKILRAFVLLLIGAAVATYFWTPNTPQVQATNNNEIAPRTDDEQQIIDVYRGSNQAVVFITTISLTYDFFSGLQPQEGTGSGLIIDAAKGIILTNYHVIENANQVEVALADGEVKKAKLVGVDPPSDIAVLRLAQVPDNLVSIPFGDSSLLEVGQRVLAIGNPFGLNRTLTIGNVSSLERTLKGQGGSMMKGLIQTDASINVGNSGGPLLDTAGRVIGINTAILSRSGDSAGIGFAVPINQIKRILAELIATGRVLRPNMGWVLLDTDQGPIVHQVAPGGSAYKAKLSPVLKRVEQGYLTRYFQDLANADVITAVNGDEVTSKDQVEDAIASAKSGDGIALSVRTAKEQQNRTVTVYPEYK